MKWALLLLLPLSAAAAAAEDPLAAAFLAAFGKNKNNSVVLKKQGALKETIKYTPGDLVDGPSGPVLLAPGEVIEPTHDNRGKLAIFYLQPSAKGYTVAKKFLPAVETGYFGKIVDYSVTSSFGGLPIVTVNGANNWQGYACSTATLIELAPEGPRRLVTLPMTYDNSAVATDKKSRLQVNGRIDKIVAGKSFDVVYFGSSDFTERYVRNGNAYVLAAPRGSRMKTC
jgi:hypothetical protein